MDLKDLKRIEVDMRDAGHNDWAEAMKEARETLEALVNEINATMPAVVEALKTAKADYEALKWM